MDERIKAAQARNKPPKKTSKRLQYHEIPIRPDPFQEMTQPRKSREMFLVVFSVVVFVFGMMALFYIAYFHSFDHEKAAEESPEAQ